MFYSQINFLSQLA